MTDGLIRMTGGRREKTRGIGSIQGEDKRSFPNLEDELSACLTGTYLAHHCFTASDAAIAKRVVFLP